MPSSLLTRISEDICQETEFINDFRLLTRNELSRVWTELTETQVKRLLESCAILSLGTERHQEVAYKIAVYLLNKYRESYKSIPFVAQLVLTRLGDLPVIEQMRDKEGLEDYFSYFPSLQPSSESFPEASILLHFPEVIEKKLSNQVTVEGVGSLTLTDLQSSVLQTLRDGKDIAISAPTSTGKSFVILNFIIEQIVTKQSYCAIYVVPTKALVAEIQDKISESLKGIRVPRRNFIVLTGAGVLNSRELLNIPKKVFVLTQERLQEIVANTELNFPVDLLVVDEAQQLSNDDRGIVIEDAVRAIIEREPRMQKAFISPNISNPDKFKKIFSLDESRFTPFSTEKSPVGQNVFYVTFTPNSKEQPVEVRLLLRELPIDGKATSILLDLGFQPGRLPDTDSAKKAWVARNVVPPKETTLIYCNKPSLCRVVASELVADQSNIEVSDSVKKAIAFLHQHVHTEYYLADFLENRVGYHYGTMPQFVRLVVKQLFSDGEIDFLACTSTLLEGVNLAAKNLILFNPRKGRDPMDSNSIRNLAGRAGRLKEDYYGKIYCINVLDWKSSITAFENKVEPIDTSSEVVLSREVDSLKEYLRNVDADVSDRVRAMGTSLLMQELLHPGSDFLSKFADRYEAIDRRHLEELETLLHEATDSLMLSKDAILRNRSFDPRLQEQFYNSMKGDGFLLLPYPVRDGVEMWRSLLPSFERIARVLLSDKTDYYKRDAVVAANWINEMPYKQILQRQIDHALKDSENLDKSERKRIINKTIEELDDIIETRVRFDYVRGMRCCRDIINLVLKERGTEQDYCQELPLYLESGASNKKILFLIGTGLSRTTAIEIYWSYGSGRTLPDWSSVSDAITWLGAHRLALKGLLHDFMYKDVERIIG